MSDPPFAFFCDRVLPSFVASQTSAHLLKRIFTAAASGNRRSWHVKCHVSGSAGSPSPSRRLSSKLLEGRKPVPRAKCFDEVRHKVFVCGVGAMLQLSQCPEADTARREVRKLPREDLGISLPVPEQKHRSSVSAPSRWRCLEGVARPAARVGSDPKAKKQTAARRLLKADSSP